MWKTYPADHPIDGLVQFVSATDSDSESASVWSFDTRGGTKGVQLHCGDVTDGNPNEKNQKFCFSFQPVGRDSLPVLSEQFIRGEELHSYYPQRDGSFALRLVFAPIHVADELLILEAILSIETDLLDAHPMIDIVSPAIRVRSITSGPDSIRRGTGGSSPISVCDQSVDTVAVLLGPHDSPFTTDRCSDEELRLRLFGDFLEKGVIRKARPWLVVRRGGQPFDDAELQHWWSRLNESPLPLTS